MTDTIVLGLDGATWDILDPLINQGRLPNIEQLISSGYSGTLESTFPPITAPAWLSMATGQNPGKTGVFYFLNRESPDSFEFKTLGSEKFEQSSYWDVLSASNRSVGVFNFPMLYPPYEVDGFMVSGLGSPEDDTITYPNDLARELNDVTDGYQIKVPYADPKYDDRPAALEADLLEIAGKRETAMTYLLDEKGPDAFFGVISATDWAQHYFWRYHDEDHVLHEPGTEFEETLTRVWKRVDETVGKIVERAEAEDAQLFLVSDHGFGPVNRTFHSNNWLRREEFTQESDESWLTKARTEYFPYLRQIGEGVVSVVPQLNDFAKSVGKSIRKDPGENVDFDTSIAFAPRQNLTCGMIYMLSDREEDKQEVISKLEEAVETDPIAKEVEIYEPEDLYEGPKTDLAPDLLFEIDDFECAIDPRSTTGDDLFSTGPPSKARNGGHNRDGIFIASGPGIDSGSGLDARIYDIAPTLLYIHDQPIPEEMDGNVLFDVFGSRDPDEEPERAPIETLVEQGENVERSDDEEVQQRLEDLGYI
ncbi:alkaline phosphatase family protein [Halorubrum ezzemoulense]|uniref:alkaline phosphatase family protein n=1 Tax=Halorubrum ezzemoulense TaxID=337243 RepID=UPI00232C751D|nr:alkaline phosphatase family protein [Halorubrum ezzemoulense]MDB2253507.1 alkaline phosphatase family protein [Halorubrum ezzemoulense]